MKTIVLILILVAVLFILIRGIIQMKNPKESKLSILEHPSTFKKPTIEMVSGEADKNSENKNKNSKEAGTYRL